ncbi:tRNA-processing ribonuclease BN [Rhynchospora pubera]|uniref:tRNA-processing ribonuclease BN n=1 Tax=Rhynchospora pubera TaxID=906938 RepID=A0AAV8G568_9POAL|nr:tRNA-processing ribonuclease BN [Rhynchospora pubera]
MQSLCFSQTPLLFPPLSRSSSLKPTFSRTRRVVVASASDGVPTRTRLDTFRGKSGAVSFCGLSHEVFEKKKLVSSPFEDESKGSLLWIVGPAALISSLLLPQLFLSSFVEAFLKNQLIAETISSLLSEVLFYSGVAAFLFVTDRVQRPYLEFSAKSWSLITGLNGYLYSSFLIMGFKVSVPLVLAYAVWPFNGYLYSSFLIAVAPFLFGCVAQLRFEIQLQKKASSCWPVLPIIFEIYRLYQLNRGAHFIERLMFSLKESASPAMAERSSAFFAVLVVLQVLGAACLWSLATFLLRLFPSRPVRENY